MNIPLSNIGRCQAECYRNTHYVNYSAEPLCFFIVLATVSHTTTYVCVHAHVFCIDRVLTKAFRRSRRVVDRVQFTAGRKSRLCEKRLIALLTFRFAQSLCFVVTSCDAATTRYQVFLYSFLLL